jgi:hypothetical protein
MDDKEVGSGGVEWIHLAQDRDRWRAVMNAVMNPRVLAPRRRLVSSHIFVSWMYRTTGFDKVMKERINVGNRNPAVGISYCRR